jgi:hypothetical protein
MKLFSFPAAALEKAIHKRILSLPIHHRDWFNDRWKQKPYKKAFIENKAMPLVTLVAKGKTWDDDTFNEVMGEWDVRFYDAEIEVLRPLVQSDGLLQLMQKNLPPERAQALLDKLEAQRIRNTDAPLVPPAEPSTD